MEQAIERLAAIGLFVIGISHVMRPVAWARLFVGLRERGDAGGLIAGFIHGPIGFVIVALHNVWTWPGVLVTLFGWALTLKGAYSFIWPERAVRHLAQISEERAGRFIVAGVVSIGVSIVFAGATFVAGRAAN